MFLMLYTAMASAVVGVASGTRSSTGFACNFLKKIHIQKKIIICIVTNNMLQY